MFCKYCGKAGGSLHGVCSVCGKKGYNYDQNGYINCSDLYDFFIHAGVKIPVYDKENFVPVQKSLYIQDEPELYSDDDCYEDPCCDADMKKEHSGSRQKVWILLIILSIAAVFSVICFFILRCNSGAENEEILPGTETSVSDNAVTSTEISVTQFQFVEGTETFTETTAANTTLPEYETTVYTDTAISYGSYAPGAYKAKTTLLTGNSVISVNSDTVTTTTTTTTTASSNVDSKNEENAKDANENESDENK